MQIRSMAFRLPSLVRLACLLLFLPQAQAATPASPPTTIPHSHPLLACLDAWPMESFSMTEWAPSGFSGGQCFFAMYPSYTPLFPITGWSRPGKDDTLEVRYLGCLPVIVKDGQAQARPDPGSNSWEKAIISPDSLPDWERMLGVEQLPQKRELLADLVIMARGYELSGSPDMARALAEKALQYEPDAEILTQEVQARYCQWQYELALDQWLEDADWQRLHEALESLLQRAPPAWTAGKAVSELHRKIPQTQTALKAADEGLAEDFALTLYGPGTVPRFFPYGNWLLFPFSQRSRAAGENTRFFKLQDRGISSLSNWQKLVMDDSPCTYLFSKDENPTPPRNPYLSRDVYAALRRRPAMTGEVAYMHLANAIFWRTAEGESLESFLEKCQKTEALLKDKNLDEKFIAAAVHGDYSTQEAGVYGLFDLRPRGPWEDVEKALLQDSIAKKGPSFALQLMLGLRGRDAGAFIQKFRPHLATRGAEEELDRHLSRLTLGEIFKDWPQHRGSIFSTRPESQAAIYQNTPSPLLATSLREALRQPRFAGEILEWATGCWERPNNPLNLDWPGPHIVIDRCREPLNALLMDTASWPIVSRARGKGLQLKNSAQAAAWLLFQRGQPMYMGPLMHEGYSLLGMEWMNLLTEECHRLVSAPHPFPPLALQSFRHTLVSFTPAEPDAAYQETLKWQPQDFRQQWAKASVTQRTFIASKFLRRLDPALSLLRDEVQTCKGGHWATPGQPAPENLPNQLHDWMIQQAKADKGACTTLIWRPGLGGVDIEAETFEDPHLLSPAVTELYQTAFQDHAQAGSWLIISARCHHQARSWMLDPATADGARFAQEFAIWQSSSMEMPLAQTSLWMCTIPRKLLPQSP